MIEYGNAKGVTGKTTGNTAILVVSFGTGYNENGVLTIGAIEEDIANLFPDYEVRRAFAGQRIIDKLKKQEGLEIDNVQKAFGRAAKDGIKNLIVQPTYLTDGYEYKKLSNTLKYNENKFNQVALGAPLLFGDTDFDAVVKAITDETSNYDDGQTAICFMGHGTKADSNCAYSKLQERLGSTGFENYYVGTIKAKPSLDDVMGMLKEKGCYKKVVLQPLLVVAGSHANRDMAGNEEHSWKTTLESRGYEVVCLLKGLGQIEAIRELYKNHAQEAFAGFWRPVL